MRKKIDFFLFTEKAFQIFEIYKNIIKMGIIYYIEKNINSDYLNL